MRRLMLLTLAAFLPVSTLKADAPAAAVIPFTLLDSGHFLVPVKLNGKGPYQLVFDTGAPAMLINNRIARDSGVITPKTPRPLIAPFNAMGEFAIKRLDVGGLEAAGVKAMVVDHPTVELFSQMYEKKHGKIEGIVGFPFFARYVMTVDYQAKTLTLLPSDYKPKDLTSVMFTKLLGGGSRPKVVAAAGQWGLTVGKSADDETAGVVVESVLPGSASAVAGIKPGDRLLTIDGRWTESAADAVDAASRAKPGKPVRVTYSRNDAERAITVTPATGF